MKIWLLENGERTGPHEIYEIRDRISNHELLVDTPAWYEGADGWVTLGEVPAYSTYFNNPESDEVSDRVEQTNLEYTSALEKDLDRTSTTPEPATFNNEPLHAVRRFFARMLDISLYTTLLYIIKVQMGVNPLFETVQMKILSHIPYLLLDGLALSYIGTTPGKWLLNIKLRTENGKMLDVVTSLIRSVRVWILGFAMQSVIILISIPFSWYIASKYGKFLWDISKNNVTRCGVLTPIRIIGYFFVFISMSYLFQVFVPPEMIPTMEDLKALSK